MPTVLFADDTSLESDRAWLWLTQQTWAHWSLETLTCEPPPLVRATDSEPARAHEHPGYPRVVPAGLEYESVHHLLTEEDPRLAVTNREDVGLVVIGQRGRGALKALHLGSTAEYVVQHLAAPTLIARKACRVRSVLVCVDGSVHAQHAVDALLAMPWLGQVDGVRVIGVYSVGAYDNRVEIGAAVDDTIQRLREAPTLACEPTAVLREGGPAFAILDEATSMSADLVVLGTRGLHALRMGLLWGSTARAVIKLTESSVLVAHGEDV